MELYIQVYYYNSGHITDGDMILIIYWVSTNMIWGFTHFDVV